MAEIFRLLCLYPSAWMLSRNSGKIFSKMFIGCRRLYA